MSEPRDEASATATTTDEAPSGLIVLGDAGAADAGECADGFCAL